MRRLSTRTILLSCALTVSVASWPALTYPIPPVPLWDLVEGAELIVLAHIETVEEPADPVEEDRFWFPDHIAELVVQEVWKGAEVSRVRVEFPASLICPAPPRYEVNEQVLAFLARDEDAGWRTVGLSYGTLYPQPDDIEDFRTLVSEAVHIQAVPWLREPAKRQWLVNAASSSATRWHALYELLPETDRLHNFYDSTDGQDRVSSLTLSQLDQIARGFVEDPPVDRTLPMALAVLETYGSNEVDEAAVFAIEALLLEEYVPWWIPDALLRVLMRYGDVDPEGRLASLGGPLDKRDPEEVREVWFRAKGDLGIPHVLPARRKVFRIWGVGSSTPD